MPKWMLVALLLVPAVAGAQEKVLLQHKAVKGQVMTYKSERTINAEFMGNKLVAEMRIGYRVTIQEVAADGTITRETSIDEADGTFNGERSPAPPEVLKQKRKTVLKPDGTVVSSANDQDEDPRRRKSGNREFQGQWFAFATRPVGVGDKWSHEWKETDSFTGGISEYELLAFEKVGAADTAKLKLNYRETTGERKLTIVGEGWIEKASGDVVKAEYKLENMQFGPPGSTASAVFKIERTAGVPNPAPGQASASAPPKKDKQIEEVVKDFEKLTGIFTLWRKKEQGRETLYLEVNETQLDKLLLLQVTASTGTGSRFLAAGEPLADIPFRLVRRDEQLLLVVPNLNFLVDPKKPIARAVKRSFPDAFLEAFRIEAKSDERKSLLINVTELFRSDLALITLNALAATGGMFNLDKEKTAFTTIKVFPDNLLVQTAYHLSRGINPAALQQMIPGFGGGGAFLADPRSLPLTVNYNLLFLPENNGYRPRLSDSRVGYFTNDFDDLTEGKEDLTKRFILRWHLEKKDPAAKLSPPRQPIVFWIDNATPEEYRDAVKRGLLLWNKALEPLGYQDAIVVKQMPDNADWDHADMRYNVIHWVASPANGYAVAQFRVNPLTGQILNAGITVDASMVRFARMEFERLIDPQTATAEANALLPFHRFRCTHAREALPVAWLGLTAMNLLAGPGGTKVAEKKYIDDFLVEVVCHEMGHIMGLRHNFIASTQHSLKELADGSYVRKAGVVASVMDYNPYNPMALRSKDGEYWTTTVGAYDLWAIEYGYTTIAADDMEGEKEALRKIACRTNQSGLAYHSDEVADQFDPLITRFDLGRDPLEYWAVMFTDMKQLLARLPYRMPARGENYWHFTRTFLGLLRQQERAAAITTRYIGGLRLSGNHKGDPGEKPPLIPVSAAEQHRALALLQKHVFARDAFRFPESALVKLAPNPYPDLFAAFTGQLRQDSPVRDQIVALQRNTLAALFHPRTLNRISNNEYKTRNTLTLPTLFDAVADSIWEEARSGLAVESLRRELQRTHLTTLTDLILAPPPGAPEDARMLARHHLRALKPRLIAAQKKSRDEYTRIHYAEALDQLGKALEARVTIAGRR